MSRRTLLAASAAGLAVLGAAVAPWTLSGGLSASVGAHLQDAYGIDLSSTGRSTFALLPAPRVKFQDVVLSAKDGSLAVEGGTLRGELALGALLFGDAVLSNISLEGSRVTLGTASRGLADLQIGERLRAGAKGSGIPVAQLKLANVSIRLPAAGTFIDDANLVASWSGPNALLQAAGNFRWRGERVSLSNLTLNPGALAAGQTSPLTLAAEGTPGRLSVQGTLQLGDEPRLSAKTLVEARSLRAVARWTGIEVPLGFVANAAAIEGEVSADKRRISWPVAQVRLGSDALEGSLAVRLGGERPLVAATLAAETLNLSEFAAPLLQARAGSGQWSSDEVAIGHSLVADLDLRLSASTAQVARVKVTDLAANLLVRPGRVEASVGRAVLNGGSAKGRLALAATESGAEFKTQGSFDRIDVAALLADTRQPRWLAGTAQGQFHLEGVGATPAEIVRQSYGRFGLLVKQGELIGIGLNDALRRVEKQPLAASLEWKGGRTAFDQLAFGLNIAGGQGEIVEGTLSSSTLRTAMQGRVSLVDRAIGIKAQVDSLASSRPPAAILFDLTGGWDDVAILPDARSLIERSGAAKPLFAIERVAPTAAAPAPGPTRGAAATPAD